MAERPGDEFSTLFAAAAAEHRAGRLSEAEAAYRLLLGKSPGHAVVHHNLGVIMASQSNHACAINHFDQAIAAEAHYASAHYNRAVALEALGRATEAIQSYGRACAIEPDHYASHRALGFLWLAVGETGRALDHFARTYELRRGEDRTGMATRSLTAATRAKLAHDAAQFRYLSQSRRDGQRFEKLARTYEDVAKSVPVEAGGLSATNLERLGEDYNTAIHICAAPELVDGAVRVRDDRDDLVRRFKEGRPGVVFFDDLLTPGALRSLRRFLLESTVWHDFGHIGGFVASYLEDGLACPLVLQIADELRRTFPEVLGEHPLSQAWAFKGLESRAAVDVHGDDAAVSVNFWVTPTEANLTPGRGGLAVSLTPPPSGWTMRDYDDDRDRIVAFLAQNPGDTLLIPYRENRAVLFESRLFHHSDAPMFAEGYENHRINLTLLFGRHGAA